MKLSRDLDTRYPVSDSQHSRANAYALNAHQDAGTAISAVRTWKEYSMFGARMKFTPTAGVVAGLIDNF